MHTIRTPSETSGYAASARATGPIHHTRWAAIVTFALATLIVASELSMAAIALPHIGSEFGVSAGATAWVLLSYSLPLAALALPAGRWVDRADVRLVFIVSLAGVALASILAAIAPSFWALLVARVLQGLAAATYLAIYLPVVTAAVREDQRGRAMSYISTIMLVGSMAITPLGGFVAGTFGWREVFLLKAPPLVLVLWLGSRTIPVTRGAGDDGIDGGFLGFPLPDRSLLPEVLLVGGALTAGLLALDLVEVRWPIAAGLAIVAAAMICWWTRIPVSRPVIALLHRRSFGLPILSLALMASIIGLIVFSLPFYIADVMQRGPEILGVAILFFVGGASVVAPIAGMLADRYGPVPVATVGGALTVAGMLTMLTLGSAAQLPDLAWRMVVIGIGMALFNSPAMTAILNATPQGQSGAAGGVTSIARTLGTTIGPAVAALAWSLGGGGNGGFHAGVIVLTAFAFAGFIMLLKARERVT